MCAAARGRLHRCLLAATSPTIAAPAALSGVAAAAGTATAAATAAVVYDGWLRGLLLLWLTTRQVRAGPIAHGDEQRGNVFAVLVGLLKGRAGAVRGDAFPAQADRHFIRFWIRALDSPLRVRLVEADVIDDFALFVVETA